MIQKFLEHISTEKRYSQNTIVSYKKDLETFLSFCMDTEGVTELLQINKKVIRNFMVYLNENGLAKRSINRKLSSLRSFYSFLMKIDEIKVSPLETIDSLKFYPKKQIPISVEEMKALELRMEDAEDVLSNLIIEVLYQTGIRRAELCTLEYRNVDFGKNEIRVLGKGNKMRQIPISDNLKTKLENYLTIREPNESAENLFFVNKKGKKLTEKFVYLTVTSYLSLVSSKEKKSPHILRHSFATHILDNGAEISKIQKILGHVSLASTQVYTNANIEQLKKVFNNAHPRAKK
jgi:integrase/recombinase XerC